MKALIRLTKEQTNAVLDGLDLLVATYASIETTDDSSDRVVEVNIPQLTSAEEAYSVVLLAGEEAGWTTEDSDQSEPAPDLTVDPFELPEEDDITGYPV